jgi:hypothetical protein
METQNLAAKLKKIGFKLITMLTKINRIFLMNRNCVRAWRDECLRGIKKEDELG